MTMTIKSSLARAALLAALTFTPVLSACGTIAGAGKDISKGGEAIEDTANDAAQ